MIQGGEMSMQDYVAIAKRRWPVLAVLAFLGCVIAFGVARVLPKKYTSQTTVLVDPSRVSKEVVAGVFGVASPSFAAVAIFAFSWSILFFILTTSGCSSV